MVHVPRYVTYGRGTVGREPTVNSLPTLSVAASGRDGRHVAAHKQHRQYTIGILRATVKLLQHLDSNQSHRGGESALSRRRASCHIPVAPSSHYPPCRDGGLYDIVVATAEPAFVSLLFNSLATSVLPIAQIIDVYVPQPCEL